MVHVPNFIGCAEYSLYLSPIPISGRFQDHFLPGFRYIFAIDEKCGRCIHPASEAAFKVGFDFFYQRWIIEVRFKLIQV